MPEEEVAVDASQSRREVWLIPKRCNIHQIIGMVDILATQDFNERIWNHGKQEALGTKMGLRKLTDSGRSITGQSVRTLLANGPKYLGFVYIDDGSKKIFVTDIGLELIRENLLHSENNSNLSDWENNNPIDSSEAFKKQLSKLILNNPLVRTETNGVLVFPFRNTVKLALDLEYLDIEELAYIVFSMKSEDEYDLIKERIINFRALTPLQRDREIEAYSRTEAGQLTLVKAPSAGYYMSFCCASGLFERTRVNANRTRQPLAAIKLRDQDGAIALVEKYQAARIYDFKENLKLWIEYYSSPNRLFPPHDITINFKANKGISLVEIFKDGVAVGGDIIDENNSKLVVPMFPDEPYSLIAYDSDASKNYEKHISVQNETGDVEIDLGTSEPTAEVRTSENIKKLILEMFSSKSGFDSEYEKRLNLLLRRLSLNRFDSIRKGGRLEFLFSELLEQLKSNGVVDFVNWYGSVKQYGLAYPAPGGLNGNPDIVFGIDNITVVLELTTIRANAGQWAGSEAASVPDHIQRYQRETGAKDNILGIFCAPSINDRVRNNFAAHSERSGRAHICLSVEEMLELLSRDRQHIIQELRDLQSQSISRD